MTKTHTPGPWEVNDHPTKTCRITGPNGLEVAQVWCTDYEYGAANAALIARAPTLLAENEQLREFAARVAEHCDETARRIAELEAFTRRVGYEPVGAADASAATMLDTLEIEARVLVSRHPLPPHYESSTYALAAEARRLIGGGQS